MSGRKINTKEDKRNQGKARVFIGEVGCVLMGGEVSSRFRTKVPLICTLVHWSNFGPEHDSYQAPSDVPYNAIRRFHQRQKAAVPEYVPGRYFD